MQVGDTISSATQMPCRDPTTLHRARLVDSLHEHVDRRLLLLVGPAGSGKTTLLLDFAAEVDFPVCWLTLQPRHRDPRDLFEGLVAAVRSRFPDFGATTLALLDEIAEPAREIATLTHSLIGEINRLAGDFFALVLDDYYRVDSSPAANQALDTLLYFIPEHCRLVLVCRRIPRLQLRQLTERQQLFGVGSYDLSLTADEVRSLVARRQGLLLLPDEAHLVAEYADGWPMALALAMHARARGLSRLLRRCRGRDGPALPALLRSALAHLPASQRTRLLELAVPDLITPAVCAELLGPGDWATLLDHLATSSPFLRRFADGCRIPTVLRQELDSRLRERAPERHAALHRRAAALAERAGDLHAALAHFVHAGDYPAALALIERAGPRLGAEGRWQTILDWCAAIPEALLADRPLALILRAHAALATGDLDLAATAAGGALAAVRRAEGTAGERSGRPLLAGALLARARSLSALGGRRRLALAGAMAMLRAALEAPRAGEAEEPGAELLMPRRATLWRELAMVLNGRGNLTAARAALEAALAETAPEEGPAPLVREALGDLLTQQGELGAALDAYGQALQEWQRRGGQGARQAMARLRLRSADLHLWRGEMALAEPAFARALADARSFGLLRWEALALAGSGDVALATGRPTLALERYQEALVVARWLGDPAVLGHLLDLAGSAWRLLGDLDRAELLLREASTLAEERGDALEQARRQVGTGALLLARQQLVEALRLLRPAQRTLARLGTFRDRVRALLYLAEAAYGEGDVALGEAQAAAALAMVDEIGAPGLLALEALSCPTACRAAPGELARACAALPLRPGAEVARPEPPAPVREMARGDPPLLTIATLGRTVVHRDSQPLCNEDRHHEQVWRLFFYLLDRAEPPRAEQICTALWPDLPLPRARSRLHTAIHRLQRLLAPSLVVIDTPPGKAAAAIPRYHLQLPPGSQVDVEEFEQALGQARRQPPRSPTRAALLQRAVALYGGPYLAGLPDDWCRPRRERLALAYRDALEELLVYHAVRGEDEAVVRVCDRLLELDPLRETVVERQIEALLRLRQAAAAIERYRHFAALLRVQHDGAPGARLQALHQHALQLHTSVADRGA